MILNVTLWGADVSSESVLISGVIYVINFAQSLAGSTTGDVALFGVFTHMDMFLATGFLAAMWIGGKRMHLPPIPPNILVGSSNTCAGDDTC